MFIILSINENDDNTYDDNGDDDGCYDDDDGCYDDDDKNDDILSMM